MRADARAPSIKGDRLPITDLGGACFYFLNLNNKLPPLRQKSAAGYEPYRFKRYMRSLYVGVNLGHWTVVSAGRASPCRNQGNAAVRAGGSWLCINAWRFVSRGSLRLVSRCCFFHDAARATASQSWFHSLGGSDCT